MYWLANTHSVIKVSWNLVITQYREKAVVWTPEVSKEGIVMKYHNNPVQREGLITKEQNV